ncbi:hypothetical protein, variant [Aphanomyces invadans]|uniref:START domain-containing protein n=1 Tax=Aphanomyces invadans TaxID=157072 RepID=A0A024UI77_9STRA|nr:hypothetical protein, variant [Aphanomyces invadans]ETW05572.1 hypothetical protein, variant [Aphanomyces invadans]|eukprot:XP_008865349.1 hypothetical protein, variant [Aphanomyces invadans]
MATNAVPRASKQPLSPSTSRHSDTMSPRHSTSAARTSSNPENIMMLFDKICSDYFMARYASNDSGRHILLSSLTKLCRVINHQQVSEKMNTRIAAYCDALVADARKKEHDMKRAAKDDIQIEMALRDWMKPKFLHLLEEMRLEFELNYTGSMPEVGKEVAALGEIRIEGWLRKKGAHVNLWRERYFMIRSSANGTHILCYFRKKGDREPRGWYVLGPGCTVDEVRESPSLMESKKLFTFRIRHYSYKLVDDSNGSSDEVDSLPQPQSTPAQQPPPQPATSSAHPLSSQGSSGDGFDFNFDPKANIKKARMKKMAVAATAATAATATLVLTGGLAGIGMVGVGAAAFSSAALTASAGSYLAKSHTAPIALAAESLETAIWWRNCLLECITQAENHWRKYVQWYLAHDKLDMDNVLVDNPDEKDDPTVMLPPPGAHRRRASQRAKVEPASIGPTPRSMKKQLGWLRELQAPSRWKLYTQTSNLRVHRCTVQHPTIQSPAIVLKASLSIHATSAAQVFDMLQQLDSPFYKANSVIRDARVVSKVDSHNDILFWQLQPMVLWPVVVEGREVVLARHWRREANGTYVMLLQSTSHHECPSTRLVRAEVVSGSFVVAPPAIPVDSSDDDPSLTSCLVTFVLQVNPRGWLDTSLAIHCTYGQSYTVAMLEMLVDLKAACVAKQYKTVRAHVETSMLSGRLSRTMSTEETVPLLPPYVPADDEAMLACRHALPSKFWAEPVASNFMVRSVNYLIDKSKEPSERQIFRLLGVECFLSESAKAMESIGLQSLTGVPNSTFFFVVNILFPPHYRYDVCGEGQQKILSLSQLGVLLHAGEPRLLARARGMD